MYHIRVSILASVSSLHDILLLLELILNLLLHMLATVALQLTRFGAWKTTNVQTFITIASYKN